MDNQNLITKLNEIRSLVNECLNTLSSKQTSKKDIIITKQRSKKNVNSNDYILAIVNKIKNCNESEKIEQEILDKRGIPGRVLLPFYICYKYFLEQGLTTGDIEKITLELRAKVKTSNVSKNITEFLWKYLDGDSSRVKGKVVVYKLNRKGARYFESLLNPNGKN